MTIDVNAVYSALKISGFVESEITKRLFLYGNNALINPAFYCVISKKDGMIRFGGGLGLYFDEFERFWNDNLSRKELALGFTLPLIMLIDNYIELIEKDVFSFTDDFRDIVDRATRIYDFCLALPQSIEEFDEILKSKYMLGKKISSYLHIRDYNDNENIYLRKSTSFIHWFATKWPSRVQNLYDCLTNSQLKRILQ